MYSPLILQAWRMEIKYAPPTTPAKTSEKATTRPLKRTAQPKTLSFLDETERAKLTNKSALAGDLDIGCLENTDLRPRKDRPGYLWGRDGTGIGENC